MERFPAAIRTASRAALRGRINNLYIDFNGLIHEALVRAAIVKQPFSEAELQLQIASYLNAVVTCVGPTKKVVIAIDGPAPNAKIR